MIQHRAARSVLSRPWRRNASDSVRLLLHSLRWPTLQLHRKCTTLMYKLLNNLLSVLSNYLPAPSLITTTRSSHDLKLMHYQPSLDCNKYSFFPRTVPRWNILPLNIASEANSKNYCIIILIYNYILAFMPLVGPAN